MNLQSNMIDSELIDEKQKRSYTNPKCCKRCGSTEHVRSCKYNCPKHPNYVDRSLKPKRARGRPKGSRPKQCKRCGSTEHVNCSKLVCPMHPEYKPKRARLSSEYNLFVKENLVKVKRILGQDVKFGQVMRVTGILWRLVKETRQ